MLLEDCLGLTATRGGFAIGVIQQLIGLTVGLLDDSGRIGLGFGAGLGGITICGGAGMFHLVCNLDLHRFRVLLGPQPDVISFFLGEVQHLDDPFSEGREIGSLAVRTVCLGLAHLFLEFAHLLLQPCDTTLGGLERLIELVYLNCLRGRLL